MPKRVSLLGKRFGRLELLEMSEKKGRKNRTYWVCKCDCGKVVDVSHDRLQNGYTKSCGCLKLEKAIEKIKEYNEKGLPNPKLIHGCSGTRIYDIYNHMIDRCYKPKDHKYMQYGGRGITVCDEWIDSPSKFFDWAFKNGYSDELTIDRIDVNGNYSPSNCRWATLKQQANNKRNNVKTEVNGEVLTLSEIADKYGFRSGTIWWRYKHGWRNNALIKPIRRWNNENYA